MNSSALENLTESSELWIFGYGSLLWKPNFEYSSKVIGHIEGFERRFWQGSIVHRGTADSPGRVATVVPSQNGKVWGIAYQLCGEEEILGAMDHLNVRECQLGGYVCYTTEFYPKKNKKISSHDKKNPLPNCDVLLYFATPDNELYMGVTSTKNLAEQIATTEGVCGHNVEYIIKIADFMREDVSNEEVDDYLQDLEKHILAFLKKKRICWKNLTYGSKHRHECTLLSMNSIPEMETSMSVSSTYRGTPLITSHGASSSDSGSLDSVLSR